ncbi:hypothetical protein PL8927_620009 [Planktothrix serta PCC 8927]|uniref:Uncharacterized protein n=1 Tax=Planktothrix serta PCC 8927 TaxID=671068 RepID=A0A7Z9BP48_9CYAN|nr:hypothetical protein PL8927_620009 [Planktothrix serta PCC 8927]
MIKNGFTYMLIQFEPNENQKSSLVLPNFYRSVKSPQAKLIFYPELSP